MSGKTRWRYGDTNPVLAAVNSATVIKIGDLVYQDVNNAKPASMIDQEFALSTIGAWNPQNIPRSLQQPFARAFLGVAMQPSQSGDIDPIRVATTGVFEFDCLARMFELGDLMGVDYNLHEGNDGQETSSLFNQQVIPVDASRHDAARVAVARVANRVAAPATSVLIDIRSTVMTGGILGG